MNLIWLALLSTPLDAWTLRTRCVAQHQISALVERCNQTLKSSGAKVVARPRTLDAGVLAEVLGAPTEDDGWLRFPKTLPARGGQCAVSMRADGAPLTLRLAASQTDPAGALSALPVEPRCPNPADLDLLVSACASAWHEEVDRSGLIGPHDAWSPRPGVHFEQRPYGLYARFDVGSVMREQLAPIFGPGEGTANRRTYRTPPPLTATGRRCQADARFVDGRLQSLDVYRAAQWRGPAAPGEIALFEQTRSQLSAIDGACQRGPRSDTFRAGSGDLVGSWLSVDASAVRLVDLFRRYGAGKMVRHRRDLDDVVVWDAHYIFDLPATQCRLEVEVMDLIGPVHQARLRWKGHTAR